mgnify:CR=1 FL=1
MIDSGLARDQALLAAQQGDDAADREGVAGRRQSARRALRPRRRRRVRRVSTTMPTSPRVPATPSLKSCAFVAGRGDPAHGLARSRRGRRRFRSSSRRARARIADGYQLLQELGAVDDQRAFTPLGARARRSCRSIRGSAASILAAKRRRLPRRNAGHRQRAGGSRSARRGRMDKRQAADQAHLRFRDERSDFLSLIALWQFFTDALADKLSHRAPGRALPGAFRVLPAAARMARSAPAARRAGRRARLEVERKAACRRRRARATRRSIARSSPGLLSNIGAKADSAPRRRAVSGRARDQVLPAPGLGHRQKPPKWVLAAELTETTRLYAALRGEHRSRRGSRKSPATASRDLLRPALGRRARRSRRRRARRASTDSRWWRGGGARFGAVDPAAAREVFLREALWSPASSVTQLTARAVFHPQPAIGGRYRRARAQGAPPGRAGRR